MVEINSTTPYSRIIVIYKFISCNLDKIREILK